MNNTQRTTAIKIAVAAFLAVLLSSCSVVRDLQVTNTCGQPATVGVNAFSTTNWYPLAESDKFTIDVGGTSEISLSVNLDDARSAPFVAIDLDDMQWKDGGDSFDSATLDLNNFGLCP